MNQEKSSSSLALIYLLAVALCLVLLHFTQVITTHLHDQEMYVSHAEQKKSTARKIVRKQEMAKQSQSSQVSDSLVLELEVISNVKSDTVLSDPPTKETEQAFFDNLLKEYQEKVRNGSDDRSDVVIRYYKKKLDDDRVYNLRKLGFYIHERPANVQFDIYPSNAIFYGDSVKTMDIILIAHNLIKGGVKVQSITLSKYHDNWKAHSIEIGTDTTALDNPPMTLAALRKKWEDL